MAICPASLLPLPGYFPRVLPPVLSMVIYLRAQPLLGHYNHKCHSQPGHVPPRVPLLSSRAALLLSVPDFLPSPPHAHSVFYWHGIMEFLSVWPSNNFLSYNMYILEVSELLQFGLTLPLPRPPWLSSPSFWGRLFFFPFLDSNAPPSTSSLFLAYSPGLVVCPFHIILSMST